MIAQNEEVAHRRATAVVTIAAGVTSLASLIVGLSGADFDFEAVSEAATFIALGTDADEPVRWGSARSSRSSSDRTRRTYLSALGWLGSRSFVTPQREHLTGPQVSAILCFRISNKVPSRDVGG